MTHEEQPDVEAWAGAHGLARSDDQLSGTTPLLRLGEIDTTDDVYVGELDEHNVWLAEYSIGSPRPTAALGDPRVEIVSFTVFVVRVDASQWPRLTVHPAQYSEHDLFRRLRHADHRVATISPEFDRRYRVIASTAMSEEQLNRLLSPDLVAWWLRQAPEFCFDIEAHKREGGFLSVAHLGLGLEDAALDQLLSQTRRLLAAIVGG